MKKIMSLFIIFFGVFLIACTKEKVITITGVDTVQVGATMKLELDANFTIEDELVWSSSDETIATVVGGIVKGISVGDAMIKVETAGLIAEKTINVTKRPFEIIISGANKVAAGEEIVLQVTTVPVVTGQITYRSNDESIVMVNSEGIVTGINPGMTNIVVSIDGVSEEFTIDVYAKELLDIIISGEDVIRIGKSTILTSNIDVYWSSSNLEVAEVYADGEVIAVGPGDVTITATDITNPNNQNTFLIKIIGKVPTGIIISGRNKVSMNQSTLLTITAYPEGANNAVIWSSRDENIATVDEKGNVTGVALGKTAIKAVSLDNENLMTVFNIEVIAAAPDDIILTGDTEVNAGEFIYLNLQVIGSEVTKEVTWTVTDKTILKVVDGIVLGLTAGTTTIRATSILNDQVYDEITVSVNPYMAPLENENDLDYVNTIIAGLTLEEKIGQMLIFSYNGTSLTTDASNAISQYKLGNFIHMGYNVPDGITAGLFTTELQNKIVATTKIPGFICIDQEGGRVARLVNGGTRFIGNMAIAATNNPENAYLVGEATGEELRNYGINFDLAPVLDVNNNPNNPVINNRSYSDNAITVSLFGQQMIAGLAESNVMGCAKHFPGHGNTSTDSHTSLPKITSTKEDLYAIELAPFISAIASGIDAIMTTHIIFSAIDKEYPATLSRAVLTDLLRDELGYQGIIVTDGMEMKAIADNYGVAQAAVLAVKAGADMLAYTTMNNPITAHQAIKEAVINGEISEARINDSVRRILLKKVKYNLFDHYLPSDDYQNYDLSAHQALNLAIAQQAVTVHLGDFSGLDQTKTTLILSTKASLTLEPNLSGSDNSFGSIASKYLRAEGFTKCDYLDISSLTTARVTELIQIAEGYQQVVIAIGDATSTQINLVNQISSKKDDLLVIGLNLPYDINKYAATVNHYLCIYEYSPIMVDALKRLLNGEYSPMGKTPIVLNK
ncbi:MAG: glycoside hydrolase family 3 N-terminal domain-containing protein [Bacilli bacterium]|nr:glycoside hydrolase family 3 N-terminal domain-containing protein [Bacilli bacterium]MDD4056268.1 glycoside hydrolase family 3 N-terminal domain-containing protein [Bacilli bacterium]